ncbi:NADase-type glycan-binding domain-containing protein [Streptomyces erythrochromogenes]|uniref:NADase-type glycan-binding domain-containing protein n=1 Tax=Streptomyces erythrochromogenes TaxID=285574 RepID=UPI003868626E|nr:zinc ribbon domain-containing protein [Streptomyces erythrochromogenes]
MSWLRRRPSTATATAAAAGTASGPAADRRWPWPRRRADRPAPAGAEPYAADPAEPAVSEPGRTAAEAPAPAPGPVAPVRPAPPAPRPPAAPAEASPAPVLPAMPVAPRPVVRPLAVNDDVAGVPCPACGTPNPPDRRFCRRCATPLTPSTAAAPLPWWRTVWPLRRHRRTRAGSGRLVRFLVVLAVVLALCAAGLLLLPAGRHLVQDTLDKLGKAKAVTPTRVRASAELPKHPVGQSTDGLSNRYWGAPGPGASATYTFGKPFRLVAVIVTNGASPAPEEYAKQGRALRIDMEVTDRDGATVHKKLVLSDKPGPQTFPTGISDATTIRLTLEEPAGSAPQGPLALAEVEFFQRS